MKTLSSLHALVAVLMVAALASCSVSKHIPEGHYLLDEVKIETDNDAVRPSDMRGYVRQNANAKWFSLVKVPLYTYCLSGPDSTRWYNKFLRRIGDAPVIYDEALTQRSQEEITKALHNMGYLGGTVGVATETSKKKLRLTYRLHPGQPYVVDSIHYDIPDPRIARYLREDSAHCRLNPGMLLDINQLEAERARITECLLRNGYYRFNKDFITYTADTVRGTRRVGLTLHLLPYKATPEDTPRPHYQYRVRNVSFIADYDALRSSALTDIEVNDSVHYGGCPIYFKDKLFIRPKVLADNLHVRKGELYDDEDVQRTYAYFGRLRALKYTNLRFLEVQDNDSTKLDCYVMLSRSKEKSFSAEIEGTNSAGDLGAAASVSFQHRNLFRGSELFTLKVRGAYEAITGLQGYNYNNYTEYGAEASLNFPSFMFPFLKPEFKRNVRATSEVSIQYNSQIRPEFARTVASATWSLNLESAGNILYGLSNLVRQRKVDGQYAFWNIAYAQYVKGDIDFSKNFMIDERNSFAIHAALGVAYPYGNSTMLPFEKRYFSGGANSVRGWGVRTLGPGSFRGEDKNIDFMNQSGDIKLDLSVEYRTHLFWKLHGAAFIDAGNIWTIRNYPEQPGGQFRFDSFYKQIAVAYGLGIRFDFDFVVLRFDGGMKAINPVYNNPKEHYPVIHPNFRRDFAFHFAVGYPF